MPEHHLNFVYQLEGNVSEMDIFQLAPTLLALGELIQESNRALNPNGKDIGVNVKPFRDGSFIVDLTLFPDSQLRQLLDFLRPHSLEQLKALLESIGLISGAATATVVGAIKAIKFLGGRPKAIEEIKPGEFRLTTVDDRSITVDASTHNLLSNATITTNIYKIYVDPLEAQPNIVDIKTYLKEDQGTAVTVDRSEIPSLREYANPALTPADVAETVKDKTHPEVFLNPKRGAFGDDGKDWSFRRGDEVITATLKDRDFLSKIDKGEVRLNHSDLLTVTLLEKQRVKGTIVQRPTYEILKVTSYQPGRQTLPLPPVDSN
jgi:hypothetical protein